MLGDGTALYIDWLQELGIWTQELKLTKQALYHLNH
jgi:hypothetical protein